MATVHSRWAVTLATLFLFAACSAMDERICLGHPCPKQSKACKDFITCYEATGFVSRGSLDTTYGPNGSCWTISQAAVDSCTSSCASGSAALKAMVPDAGCP